MGAASVTVDGEIKFQEVCGWADAEWKIKNTVDTKFRTGSVGKQFTAAAILLLHEQGKLQFSDSIGKFVDNLQESSHTATIHELLNVTSCLVIPLTAVLHGKGTPRWRFLL